MESASFISALLLLIQMLIIGAHTLTTITSADKPMSPTATATTTTSTPTSNNGDKTNTVYQLTQCEKSKVDITCPNDHIVDILYSSYARQNIPQMHAQCHFNNGSVLEKDKSHCDETFASSRFRKFILFKCQFQQQCNFIVTNKHLNVPLGECQTQIKVAEIAYRCLIKNNPFVKRKMELITRELATNNPPYAPPFELIESKQDIDGQPQYYTKPVTDPGAYVTAIIQSSGPTTPTITTNQNQQHEQPTTTVQPQLDDTTDTPEGTTTIEPKDDADDDEGPPSNYVDDNFSATTHSDDGLKPDEQIAKHATRTYNRLIADGYSTPAYHQQEIYSITPPTTPARPTSNREQKHTNKNKPLPSQPLRDLHKASAVQPPIILRASSWNPSDPSRLQEYVLAAAVIVLLVTVFGFTLSIIYLCNKQRTNKPTQYSGDKTVTIAHQNEPPPASPKQLMPPSFDRSLHIQPCSYAQPFPNPPQLSSESYFKDNLSSFMGTSPCHDVVDGPIYHSRTMVKYANMRDAYMV